MYFLDVITIAARMQPCRRNSITANFFVRMGLGAISPELVWGFRCLNMVIEPFVRMGPPPRSLAVEANDCFMVRLPRGATDYKFAARSSRS